MTRNQKIIRAQAQKNGGQITHRQVVEMLGDQYFRNEGKYISEMLSRMVRQKLLVRKSYGIFSLPNISSTNQLFQ